MQHIDIKKAQVPNSNYQMFHEFYQREAPSSGEGEQWVQGTQEFFQCQLQPSLA
jgi:hypothetical protein